MSRIAKEEGYFHNPSKRGARSPFEKFHGNAKDPRKVRERYTKALELIRPRMATDKFTAAQGYDLRKFSEWSEPQRREVRRYFNEIWHLEKEGARQRITQRDAPFIADPKLLKEAQQFAQQKTYRGKIKDVYVLAGPRERPILKYDPDRRELYQLDAGNLRKRGVRFNKKRIADDETRGNEVREKMRALLYDSEGNRARYVTLRNAQFETTRYGFGVDVSRLTDDEILDEIEESVNDLWEEYKPQDGKDPDEWLDGLNAYYETPRAKKKGVIPIVSRVATRAEELESKKVRRRQELMKDPEFREQEKRRKARQRGELRKRVDIEGELQTLDDALSDELITEAQYMERRRILLGQRKKLEEIQAMRKARTKRGKQ